MTDRMLSGRTEKEIVSDELWCSRLSEMEVDKYRVAWLSVEYAAEVGGVYLCILDRCMGEGDDAWLV